MVLFGVAIVCDCCYCRCDCCFVCVVVVDVVGLGVVCDWCCSCL